MEMEHNVEKINYNETNLEEFREKIEKKARPIILTDCLVDFQNNFNFSFKVCDFILGNKRTYMKLLETSK